MDSSRTRRAGGTLLAVLAVALLVSVVALASRPETARGGALLGADPARVILDVTTYLFIVFVLLSLAVIVWALWPRKNEEMPALPPRRRWALSTVLSMLMAVALAVWLRSSGHLGRLPNVAANGAAGRPPTAGAAAPLRGGAPAGFDWIAAAIVLALIAAGAAALWWFLLRQRRRTGPSPLQRLQAVLDDAIDDVLAEGDPRRAVIAAWARLERVLGRQGLPRRDSEAPFEYAARAGAALEVEPRWLERLADLFEWARFSTHEVTPAMREEALRGLTDIRDGLRIAAA
ncbi:MAG TPA: DUF4129 domain-containing protein [Candidatus Dormibacteraeota bacterium]|nr:DUF4129 domain-containing protein [Candidatus Dormibacteraeota bacterium]